MRKLMLGLALFSACLRRNGTPEVVNWEDRLRALAAFEMNCPDAQLKVVDLDGRGEMAGVSGCEQRRTYMYIPATAQWSAAAAVPVR